jgi:hypothetical protein
VIPLTDLDDFIRDVFSNYSALRQCNIRLLEALQTRQQGQAPVIEQVGDILLQFAGEFRTVYPIYIKNLHFAQERLKKELELNPEFRKFSEVCNGPATTSTKSHFLPGKGLIGSSEARIDDSDYKAEGPSTTMF